MSSMYNPGRLFVGPLLWWNIYCDFMELFDTIEAFDAWMTRLDGGRSG